MKPRKQTPVVVLSVLLLALAGCQAAPSPTSLPATSLPASSPQASAPVVITTTPTEKPAPTKGSPALMATSAYPYPVGAPTVTPGAEPTLSGYPYPAGPATAASATAAPNRSKLTAKLVSLGPDPLDGAVTILHAQILTTEEIPGMPSFTKSLVNQVTDLYAQTASLPALKPGDSFSAEAVYVSDNGGRLTVEKVVKIP